MKKQEKIRITGAREHNLKNITVDIPKNRLVVLTGVSGSGKSSLAFDTLFAEGQRRYVESLSSYARQFLGQMEKPRYERITGLSPTIAIEQKSASRNPRSTVGTITEIYDYLRVLYARLGRQHCPSCGQGVQKQSSEQIAKNIAALPRKTKALLLAPILQNRKGEHREIIDSLRHEGFVRARIDGVVVDLETSIKLKKNQKHSIELVVDRLILNGLDERLEEAVETALRFASGRLILQEVGGREWFFSEDLACPDCSLSFPELSPQSFSFNSPLGMCHECNGLGFHLSMDAAKLLGDPELSIRQGAIIPWASRMQSRSGWGYHLVLALEKHLKLDLDRPWKKLPRKQKRLVLYGEGMKEVPVGRSRYRFFYPGLIPNMNRRYRESTSERAKAYYLQFLSRKTCSSCKGTRLREESRHVKCASYFIHELTAMTTKEVLKVLKNLSFSKEEKKISEELLKEIQGRLRFLVNVGLDYLSLDRSGPSLSGGEGQRIRLASQIGSELTGVSYVLDEPSIGLHQRDNNRLIDSLKHLRDVGNTVVVVEHDRETIESADHLIDFGPGAGVHGGEVVYAGSPSACLRSRKSLTGAYLSGKKTIPFPEKRRKGKHFLKIIKARENNLKELNVSFPLGTFIAVTGVSGAGKSSLINGILRPALQQHFSNTSKMPGDFERLEGLEFIDKVIAIDQSPIGRTPRSNPATYVKLFDPIRELFSQLRQSRIAGYRPGRFSFNVKGGRCEACQGAGLKCIEMHFLPDVYVVCQECHGQRFNEATLRVRYKNLNIAEVLDLTVEEAFDLFEQHPVISRKLQTLKDVGLDYLKLGQASTTLSGGEAQRIKLSRELAKRDTGRTLYLLDEPTTGLHFDDIAKLLHVLQRLVDRGNTVIVIEHNLDLIKCADHIVDIGPDGGQAGGRLVAEGPPEKVALDKKSRTAPYLREILSFSLQESCS
jgi:excinuclease ABC subunit A